MHIWLVWLTKGVAYMIKKDIKELTSINLANFAFGNPNLCWQYKPGGSTHVLDVVQKQKERSSNNQQLN